MAYGNSSYQIDIKTTADAAPITKTKEEIKNLTDETHKASQSLEEASGNLKETGQTAEAGGESFKIFGRGAHEAHAGLHAIGEALPGVGELARFMANDVTASIGGVVYIFSRFKDAMAETLKTLTELANSPDARGEWVDQLRNSIEEANVSLSTWEHHLQEIGNASDDISRRTADLISQQNAGIQSTTDLAAAQRDLALARVELAQRLGQITPTQAIRIRMELDEQALRDQVEQKIHAIEAEINARTHQAAESRTAAGTAADTVNQTDAAARAATAAKIRNDTKLAQDKENLTRSQARQAEADQVIETLDGKGVWGGKWDTTDPQYYQLKAAKDTQQAELSHQGQLRRAIGQEEGKRTGLDTAAATTKADADKARADYEALQNQIRDADHRVAQLQQDLAAAQAAAGAIIPVRSATIQTHAQTQNLDRAQQLQDRTNNGTAAPQERQEYAALRAAGNIPPSQTDLDAQNTAAETPANHIDVNQARAAFGLLQSHVARHAAGGPEIQELLNEFTGLARALHASSGQRGAFAQLAEQVRELRREVDQQNHIIQHQTTLR